METTEQLEETHMAQAEKSASHQPATAQNGGTNVVTLGPRDTLNGRPIADAIRTWAPAVRYLLDRADEARSLIER